jgi:hypothetical protein
MGSEVEKKKRTQAAVSDLTKDKGTMEGGSVEQGQVKLDQRVDQRRRSQEGTLEVRGVSAFTRLCPLINAFSLH